MKLGATALITLLSSGTARVKRDHGLHGGDVSLPSYLSKPKHMLAQELLVAVYGYGVIVRPLRRRQKTFYAVNDVLG